MDNPTGSANKIAIKVTNKVPLNNGAIPKCFWAKRGVHSVSVIKSNKETSLKKLTVSMDSTKMIPMVVRTVIKALVLKRNSIIFSPTLIITNYKTRPLKRAWLCFKLVICFIDRTL